MKTLYIQFLAAFICFIVTAINISYVVFQSSNQVIMSLIVGIMGLVIGFWALDAKI